MRTFVGVVLGALASGCACGADEGPPPLALSIPAEDVASVASDAEPELAPWGVRFVRRCSEWSYHGLAVGERHVFSCDGTVHELASGALVAPGGREPMLLPVARAGARTVWELGGSADLVVRAADGTLARPIAMPERVEAVFARGERLVGAGASGLVEVSLSTGTARVLPSSDACAWAHAIAVSREGRVRCVVRAGSGAVLRGIAGEPEVSVPWLESARFDADGERLVGTREGRLELVDASGAIVLSRPLGQRVELLDLAGDRALVAADGRVVIVSLASPDAPLEEIVALDAEAGRFAGDHVVISTRSRSVVWLRRGAAGGLPSREPIPAPPGLVAFEPDDREVSDPFDVATFRRDGEGEYTNVRVARLDREELAPFEHDDEAWGRMLAARYLDDGSERWARVFRDAEGRRVMRGHTWIGGCERTHIDVAVIERDDRLELWIAYTGERAEIDRILPVVPPGARRIDDGARDGYAGDPSIGRIAP